MRTACLSLCLILACNLVPAQDSLIGRCGAQVRDRPDQLESYRCYWAASRQGETGDALRALEALLALDGSNHRARLYLAAIKADHGDPDAERLYLEALAGLRKTGERTGEVYALLALEYLYRNQGRIEEAAYRLEEAVQPATASGDGILLARVRTSLASHQIAGADFGLALQTLKQAEEAAFPDGPHDLRCYILSLIGKVYWNLGMLDKALASYRREAELWNSTGDFYMEASPRYNMARLSARLFETGSLEHDAYMTRVHESLQTAIRVHHRPLEARSRLLLGQATGDRTAGRSEIQTALAICMESGDRQGAREAMRLLADRAWRGESDEDLEAALQWADRAIEDAKSTGNPAEIASGLITRAGILYDIGDRERWIEAYEQTIRAVEQIRNLQPEGTVRARVFSRWPTVYYRYAGALLDGLPDSPDPELDLDVAFRIVERLRSRVLLDEIDAAQASFSTDTTHPDKTRRSEILTSIAQVQRQLSDPRLVVDARPELLDQLRRLEAEEELLRDAIARSGDRFARLLLPDIPTIAALQSLLAADQAILSFQVSSSEVSLRNRFNDGGSWLLVISRDSTAAFALPDEEILKAQTGMFLGLCQRGDGSEVSAAGHLYDELLAEGIRTLPGEVSRLIVMPDGHLNRFPFAALVEGSTGLPLGARFSISYAPSATLWARWKSAAGVAGERIASHDALVLADPEFGSGFADGEFRAADPWLEGVRLGALPHARKEAVRLVRRLGGASLLLSGPDASERMLKKTDLSVYSILHFATHAVLDLKQPERSAIILAPGDDTEDGFLQLREIVDLELDGQVVILSACRTVSGAVLEGEGVLSLARAFFQAGARTVVGSLWPLRDDEAGELMDGFTRHLARGQSVSEAMTAARIELIESGAPASAWAGVVVLGDGDVVPAPGGRTRTGWMIPVLLALLAAFLLLLRRRR